MKRRIILLLTTLTGLVAALYVYSLVAGLDLITSALPEMPGRPVPIGRPPRGGGASIQDANEVCIVARDKEGRLEAIYRAGRWTRRDDGSHLLIDPRVELYHRNDQRTILLADKAEVYGEELDRGVKIRRAKLSGNVRIYFDPSTEPDRAPVEERPDEVVRVHVEDVEFDNEHLSIQTDGRVTVFSPEADIYGQGLSISWNETPRELRLLRIERGQYMAVYNVPEELNMISLPGGGQEGAAATSRPASQPASQPAGADTQPVIVRIQDVKPPAGTQPTTATTASAPAKPKARNQYVAEFNRDVKVVHRSRRLQGAEKLSLRFDWDASWRKGREGGYLGRRRSRDRRAKKPPAATAPSSRPTSRPTSRPAGTQPAGPGEPEPMEIYWTGPLVIRPVGRTETPKQDRYEVTATGAKVVLTDPRATALCREFLFRHPEQTGYLRGAAESPVRLLLAEGADVASATIRFDPGRGWARLDGAGYMARRFGEGLTQEKALELIETEEPNRPPASERITWARDVTLGFTRERVRRDDGTTQTRQFIEKALFREKVVLRQSADANGEYVACDDLNVKMARGRRGTAYPSRAVATGHVSGRQEGSDIQAEKVTVDFGEAPAGAAAGATDVASAVRPEFVVAEGKVRLTDRRDPNAPPVLATADRVSSDLRKRTAVLNGSPARIVQGPNHLSGEVIRLDQREGAAEVDGKGTLRFLTRKDMNGRTLTNPRPVAVAWSKGMTFRGEKRTASFAGDVTLDGGMDQMACQSMQILFTEPPAEKPPATQPTSVPVARPASRPARAGRLGGMAVGMDKYSRRRISMILADKDVSLRSRRENAKKQLVRRVQLAGDKLIYDVQTSRLTMLEHGTFMAEDYEKPRKEKPADSDGLVAAVGRPSQTAFEWNRSMQFSQKDRLVVLDGKVKMVHRSGNQVLLADKLPVPREEWGTLEAGRKTVLSCEEMIAKFAEPEARTTTRPAERDVLQEGPDLGPIELFSASRDVNLKDGPRQILAQRLVYNRLNDVAVIWGFLEGEKPAKATVVYEDPTTGRSQVLSSPKLIWYRRNNKIISADVTGAGGR